MRSTRARAPVRIDLAGGTLDIWPVNLVLGVPAVTVNVALDLGVEAHVEVRAGQAIELRSDDLERSVAYPDRSSLVEALAAGRCPLPLLGEAVLASGAEGGFALRTRCRPPAGSGLGTSSALLGTVLGALLHAEGRGRAPRDLQPLAQDVETRLLRTPTGYQDYFPPLLGGCLALHRELGGIRVERLEVDLEALAARLRLVYTGEPHDSGITNWGVVRAFLDGEPHTERALRRIAVTARAVRNALASGDTDAAFAGILADGRERLRMAPGVATPGIEALDAAARGAGALGTKICGAGGGGCVLVLLPERASGAAIDRALAAGAWQPLPIRLADAGLVIDTP